MLEKYTLQSIYQTCKERHIKREHNNSKRKPKPLEIVKAIVENELLLILKNGMARIFQLNPTPLAISVAKKGIEAKPTNSTLIMSLNLETRFPVT